jgi:hypothetical protein
MSIAQYETLSSFSAEAQWVDLVESHVDHVWRYAVAAGLLEDEAATACELAWLRLAQRWSPLGGYTESEVRGWLEETIRAEARAVRRQMVLA